MYKKILGVDLNYINYGKKNKPTIVYLHGWGQNIQMMQPIADPFQKDFNILIIDLPGHGSSSEPSYAWEFPKFVECIHELLKELKIEKPIMVGHSFGGKISLLYASMYEVEKLVLLGSPFRKAIKKLSLKTKILKKAASIKGIDKLAEIAKKHIGSTDYKNASPIMREILVNHVNCDITEEVKKIKAEALIIWGTADDAVPIDDAYLLESLLKNAAVIPFEGNTHYAYLERLGQTINILHSFLESR